MLIRQNNLSRFAGAVDGLRNRKPRRDFHIPRCARAFEGDGEIGKSSSWIQGGLLSGNWMAVDYAGIAFSSHARRRIWYNICVKTQQPERS